MKQVLYILTLCTLYISLYGQPVLTKNISPELGTSLEGKLLEIESIDAGPAGANQTWDFSNLNGINVFDLTFNILDPSTIPNGPVFDDAEFVYNIEEFDIFNYYKIDQDSLTLVGHANISEDGYIDLLTNYLNVEDGIHFPLRFGDSHNYYSRFERIVAGYNIGILERNGTTFADGYGTLKTPYGTYSNVMRIKVTQTTGENTLTNYLWMDQGSFIPILFIELYEDPEETDFIYYTNFEQTASSTKDIPFLGLEDERIFLTTEGNISIALSNPEIAFPLSIQLMDVNGSLIHQEIINQRKENHVVNLNQNISAGYKMLFLRSENVRGSRKILFR